MVNFLPSPAWFYGIDSALEFIAVLIAFLISFYSFHIYRFVGQKKYLYFSLSFFLMGFALCLGAVINYLLYFHWLKHSALYVLVHNYMLYYEIGFLLHFFLHLAAFMILIILCLRIEDKRVMSLLFLFVLLAVMVAEQNFILFYLISFLLMVLYILPYFFKNCRENRTSNTKRVFLAFLAISLSQLCFFFSLWSDKIYAVGHLLQLVGYMVLLVNFISVFRK